VRVHVNCRDPHLTFLISVEILGVVKTKCILEDDTGDIVGMSRKETTTFGPEEKFTGVELLCSKSVVPAASRPPWEGIQC
jgi:hypothetical protein